MHTILAIIAFSLPLAARPVSLAWNANPSTENVSTYRVWRGGNVLVGTSATPAATFDLNTGDRITVSAVNSFGESLQSAAVIIPPPPDMIQRSEDLVTWVDVAPIPKADKQFIRIKITPP